MNDEFEQPIDKIIREAREKGAFEDIQGKGKPIQWGDDALVPDDQRMANQVLKNAGFLPDWLEESRQIDQDYQTARRYLELSRTARAEGRLEESSWQMALAAYTRQMIDLNRRILKYNLRAPSPALQRGQYSTEAPSQP